MDRLGLPSYLRVIVGDYLSNRLVCFSRPDSEIGFCEVQCGVPQGSRLGPLLWNLTYDLVLRTPLPEWSSVVAYADDTLALAGGQSPQEAAERASACTALIVGAIQSLRLTVNTQKTEAIVFRPTNRRTPDLRVQVADDNIFVRDTLKYLGVILDGRWRWRDHVTYAASRGDGVIAALSRLMPNLRGPRSLVRRVYANVVHMTLLYAAPAWAEVFITPMRHWVGLVRVQRKTCTRVVSGYRTISWVSACLLSSIPPINLLAEGYRKAYAWRCALRRGQWEEPWPETEIRSRMYGSIRAAWEVSILSDGLPSPRVREAFSGHIVAWCDRRFGSMNYWLTQIFTGHGNFSQFLFRIKKLANEACEFCGEDVDTARHTVERCPRWRHERRALMESVGIDLELPSLLQAMLQDRSQWKAVSTFAETVLSEKARVERVRQGVANSTRPRRKRRRGGGGPEAKRARVAVAGMRRNP